MEDLLRLIHQREADRARERLFDLIHDGTIKAADFDRWGRLAGQVDRLSGNHGESLVFWQNLVAVLERAETEEGGQTHKGLPYFKIGARALMCGRPLEEAIDGLSRSYEEDRRRTDPEGQSAYRLLTIVRLLRELVQDEVAKGDPSGLQGALRDYGADLGVQLVRLYDRTIVQPPAFRALPGEAFTILMGQNPFRATMEGYYRAAAYLSQRREEILRTNLEKYGLATAMVVMSATAVEGILLEAARRAGPITGKPALGSLVRAYLAVHQDTDPWLRGELLFLWFGRNLIHPDVIARYPWLLVDFNLGDFMHELAGDVIQRLAAPQAGP